MCSIFLKAEATCASFNVGQIIIGLKIICTKLKAVNSKDFNNKSDKEFYTKISCYHGRLWKLHDIQCNYYDLPC